MFPPVQKHHIRFNCTPISYQINTMERRQQWERNNLKSTLMYTSRKQQHIHGDFTLTFVHSNLIIRSMYIYFAHGCIPQRREKISLESHNGTIIFTVWYCLYLNNADKEPKDLNMCRQLERLALQPQRWGLTGAAEECLRLCVFCLI